MPDQLYAVRGRRGEETILRIKKSERCLTKLEKVSRPREELAGEMTVTTQVEYGG